MSVNLNPMMPDFSGGPVRFIREVRTELGKVRFPTREETIKLTIIVFVISIAFGIYIGSLDMVFAKITNLLIFK